MKTMIKFGFLSRGTVALNLSPRIGTPTRTFFFRKKKSTAPKSLVQEKLFPEGEADELWAWGNGYSGQLGEMTLDSLTGKVLVLLQSKKLQN